MIKLKNIEAAAFNSPLISKLFIDETRTFPLKTAFKLNDAVEVIKGRLKTYYEEQKKIILANGGNIKPDGSVIYESLKNQQQAAEAIDELNSVELEYQIELIEVEDSWPDLTVAEASILKPLLKY